MNRINSWREQASFSYTRHMCMVFRIFTCTWPLVDLCCPESDLSSSIDIVYHLTVNILVQFYAQFLTMGRSDRWSDDEILKLVAFWADDAVQKQLDGRRPTRHGTVFSKLADCLRGAGYERTPAHCR